MNDQAIAILNGAIAQLGALATSQQAQIDADTVDVATEQQATTDAANAAATAIAAQQKVADDAKAADDTKIAADQADITKQTADKASTEAIAASLQGLVNSNTPVPAVA